MTTDYFDGYVPGCMEGAVADAGGGWHGPGALGQWLEFGAMGGLVMLALVAVALVLSAWWQEGGDR